MIIEGQGNVPLTELQFQITIGDQVMCFKHYMPTMGPNGYVYSPKPAKGYITFADSREIDSLIRMLEQFREGVVGRVGDWARIPMATIHPWEPMSAEEVLRKLAEKE